MFLTVALLIGLFGSGTQMLVPLAAHLTPEASRGQVVGNVMSGLLAGILLARPVSSLLSEVVGWRGVFGLASLAALGLAGLLWFRLPSRRPDAPPAYGDLIGSMWHVLLNTPVLRPPHGLPGADLRRVLDVLDHGAARTRRPPLEPVADRHRRLRPRGRGRGHLGAAGRAGRRPRLHPDRHRSRARIALAGFGLCWIGDTSLAALVVGGILIDAGVQCNQILSQRAIYALAPAIRSRLNGLFIAASFIGASIGSLLAGAVFAHFGWSGVVVLGALCPGVALLLWVREMRSVRTF